MFVIVVLLAGSVLAQKAGDEVETILPGIQEQGGDYAGVWRGRVDQPGFDSYTVIMKLDRVGGGSTWYPELACGGLLRSIDGSRQTYREEITENRARCIDGTILLYRTGDGLGWRWLDDSGTEQARAVLRRE